MKLVSIASILFCVAVAAVTAPRAYADDSSSLRGRGSGSNEASRQLVTEHLPKVRAVNFQDYDDDGKGYKASKGDKSDKSGGKGYKASKGDKSGKDQTRYTKPHGYGDYFSKSFKADKGYDRVSQ